MAVDLDEHHDRLDKDGDARHDQPLATPMSGAKRIMRGARTPI
jgi:hypothetical protein